MKLSTVLYKHHIGRIIRGTWYCQGKRTPVETNAEESLAKRGIEVIDPQEFLKPKRELFDFKKVNWLKSQPIKLDEDHPDWHDTSCLTYEDNDLLTEGLTQAQQITKTIVFENTLPEHVKTLVEKDDLKEADQLVERIIQNSVIFDAHQELLPKLKDPNRPAWVFPRQMGITNLRKAFNLSKKLIQLCDCLSGPQIARNRSILDNGKLSYPFEKEFDKLNVILTMDLMLMSEKPLRPAGQFNREDNDRMKLPNIQPLHYTIGLTKTNIYKFENLYPLVPGLHKKHLHTIFIYHDHTKVKNITELEMTETQLFGRAMMKAFTAAACTARHKYGPDVKELPEPVTVQCIYSDGKAFYFSVYQLNTLDIDGENGLKNYCWTQPKMNLYETGQYVDGIPVVEGYNPEVFKRILAFYKNN